MVQGTKRKHGVEAESDEIALALKELPRSALLRFRHNLSLHRYSQAVQSLEETCPGKVLEAVEAVGSDQISQSLALVLGDRCWSFDSTADELDAASQALRTMLEDGRAKLLDALRGGASFCAAVKQYTSKRDGQPLMKLGKTRVMWLLGAGPEEGNEGNDSSQKKRPKNKKRKRKGKGQEPGKLAKGHTQDPESDVDSETSSSEDHAPRKKSESATLKFLESIKELRAAKKKKPNPPS